MNDIPGNIVCTYIIIILEANQLKNIISKAGKKYNLLFNQIVQINNIRGT